MKTWRSHLASIAAGIVIAIRPGSTQADVVTLANGDHLTGTIVSKEDDNLIFRTSYGGELKIRWLEVTGIASVNALRIYLDDDRRLTGVPAINGEGQISVQTEGEASAQTVSINHIRWINPSPLISGEGVLWEGRGNLGAVSTNGNTDTQKAHADAEVIARTLKNRYTAGFAYNRGKTSGVVSESNALGYLKYDRFLTPKWYAYLNASAERDEFKDIDLRTIVGAGSGFQFIETDRTNLSLEGGVSDVHTEFALAPDEDYPALRLAAKYEQFLFSSKVQFFCQQVVLVGMADSKRTFVKSITGLRMPVVDRVNVTMQYNLDWENEPAPGRVHSDRTVLLTLGYHF